MSVIRTLNENSTTSGHRILSYGSSPSDITGHSECRPVKFSLVGQPLATPTTRVLVRETKSSSHSLTVTEAVKQAITSSWFIARRAASFPGAWEQG